MMASYFVNISFNILIQGRGKKKSKILKVEFSGAVYKHLGERENKDEAQGLGKGFSVTLVHMTEQQSKYTPVICRIW